MKMSTKFAVIPAVVLFCLLAIMSACAAPQTTQKPQGNRPPLIEQIEGLTDWSPETTGQFTVVASDPDGDKMAYNWLADNGTLQVNGKSATWTSPATMGKYKITVVVNDGHGGETHGEKEVTVAINSDGSQTPDAPVALKLSIPSSEAVTSSKRVRIWTASAVECIVTGTDSKSLNFAWTTSNGKLQAKGLSEGTASKVTWIAPGVAGNYTVDVVVSDSQGNQAKGSVTFSVFCCGNY